MRHHGHFITVTVVPSSSFPQPAGAPVYRSDFERTVQRVRRSASEASATAPRLLTFLVSPAALTRALIVKRAELLHEWRNTILLQASASGAVGECHSDADSSHVFQLV